MITVPACPVHLTPLGRGTGLIESYGGKAVVCNQYPRNDADSEHCPLAFEDLPYVRFRIFLVFATFRIRSLPIPIALK